MCVRVCNVTTRRQEKVLLKQIPRRYHPMTNQYCWLDTIVWSPQAVEFDLAHPHRMSCSTISAMGAHARAKGWTNQHWALLAILYVSSHSPQLSTWYDSCVRGKSGEFLMNRLLVVNFCRWDERGLCIVDTLSAIGERGPSRWMLYNITGT